MLPIANACAQFNDSTHYRLAYTGTGVLNHTNDAVSYLLTNSLRINMRQKKVDANGAAAWLFGQQGNRLTNNDFSSAIDFNLRSRLPHLYYWGLGSFEKSYSLKVNNRTQGGFGLAYNILDRPDSLQLNISDGLLYEYSDLKLGDTAQNIYSIVRNSLRLRFRLRLQRIVTLEGTGFFQHSLEDGSDYIIRTNTSLSVKLRKWLALTSALNFNKVSKTRSENLLLTLGVTVEGWF